MVRVVLIDNYDSFVHNIAQYMGRLGAEVIVKRNDVSLEEIEDLKPDRIVLSPGPGHPKDSGVTTRLLETLSQTIPTMGVCLGHQALAHVHGGEVTRASNVLHGKTSEVHHSEEGIFEGVPSPFTVARYHSLVVGSIPDSISQEARTSDDECMAIKHKDYPMVGVQFHPESILTEHGVTIISNFLEGKI